MKKCCVITAAALVAVALSGISLEVADGRPQYRAQFEENFKDTKIAEAVKDAKCNVCHYGKSKKNRNDYGTALSKHLSKEVYMKLRKDKEALAKKVDDAIKAVEKEKSVSGETFGERIEAGQLPGTAPEEDDE